MNGKALPTAGEPEGGGQLSLNIQSREELTAHQVGILLNIVHTMRAVAMPTGDDNAPKSEHTIAAENTLIKACERIELLVEDNARWSLSQYNDTHKAILSAHKKQEQLMQANLELVEMHKRPSYQLKPTIATYANQYFLAFWGKLEEPGMVIVGRGPTPYLALLDFDRAFHRVPAEQFRIIADAMDAPSQEPPAETPKDFKKKNPPPNESQ